MSSLPKLSLTIASNQWVQEAEAKINIQLTQVETEIAKRAVLRRRAEADAASRFNYLRQPFIGHSSFAVARSSGHTDTYCLPCSWIK